MEPVFLDLAPIPVIEVPVESATFQFIVVGIVLVVIVGIVILITRKKKEN